VSKAVGKERCIVIEWTLAILTSTYMSIADIVHKAQSQFYPTCFRWGLIARVSAAVRQERGNAHFV
jgi:hypothetical protein